MYTQEVMDGSGTQSKLRGTAAGEWEEGQVKPTHYLFWAQLLLLNLRLPPLFLWSTPASASRSCLAGRLGRREHRVLASVRPEVESWLSDSHVTSVNLGFLLH